MRKLTFMMLLGAFAVLSCTDIVPTTSENDLNLTKLNSRSVNDPIFEFPAIQWEALETHEQKLAACEIPDSILPSIPTKDLVKICMEYPLLLDAYAFNTPLQGIKTVASRFNGFKELTKRKDNCLQIFTYLKENDIRNRNLTGLTQAEAGRITLVYALAEYVLSFDNVLRNATESTKKEIASFVNDILENKEYQVSYHSLGGLTSSIYLWASILSNTSQSRSINPTLDKFLETGIIQNIDEYQELKQQCQTFN